MPTQRGQPLGSGRECDTAIWSMNSLPEERCAETVGDSISFDNKVSFPGRVPIQKNRWTGTRIGERRFRALSPSGGRWMGACRP